MTSSWQKSTSLSFRWLTPGRPPGFQTPGNYNITYVQDVPGLNGKRWLPTSAKGFFCAKPPPLRIFAKKQKQRLHSRQHRKRGQPRLYLGENDLKRLQQGRLDFEAGEIREHVADCDDCCYQHLRSTLLQPDVQAGRCIRVEISLYACTGWALSSNTA